MNIKHKILIISLILISINSYSQSVVNKFFKLSRPEKFWTVTHIFKAKKAFKISIEARTKADSIAKTITLDGDKNGGQVDAFRHSYWQARLNQEIGKYAAKKLGIAHEKGNYLYFKKNKLEDGGVPDKISSDMDLFNNEVGLSITIENKELNSQYIEKQIVEKIKRGELKVILKNEMGQFLDCNGNIISTEELKGKWDNNKCLVNSNNTKYK